jgi:hypothetical protein
LRNGDKIDIIKGAIENRYDKEKGKLYVDVTIFEFAMSDLTKKEDHSDAAAESNSGQANNHFSSLNGDEGTR